MFEHVRQDFHTYAEYNWRPMRGRPVWSRLATGLWLLWRTETLGGLVVLRAKGWMRRRHLRLLTPALDRLLVARWGFSIGDGVKLAPGVCIPHPFIVAHGDVEVGSGTIISPWVTLGLINSSDGVLRTQGPRIGAGVYIGAGAQILGPVTIGDGAKIGANSVVIDDVPAGATAVGSPARVVAPPAAKAVAGASGSR